MEGNYEKIMLLVLCAALGSFALSGCSDKGKPFEKKSYTPDTLIKEVNIDVRDRKIEVSLSEDEQVHIDYSENGKEYYDISVSNENVLAMTSAENKEWTDYIGGKPSVGERKILLLVRFLRYNRYIDYMTAKRRILL